MVRLKGMHRFPELVAGVSTVADGNMSVKWGKEPAVNRNKIQFLGKLGLEMEDCVIANLELLTRVAEVGEKDKGKYIDCDALITREPRVALWMVVADCYATVVYDQVKSVLALVHLGRQGLDGGLTGRVVRQMKTAGSEPENLVVSTSPGLKRESYTWQGKLPMKKDWGKYVVSRRNNTWLIDTGGFLRQEFVTAGVKPENIHISPVDVYTDKRYFSHVRSVKTGEPEGRFATVVMKSV